MCAPRSWRRGRLAAGRARSRFARYIRFRWTASTATRDCARLNGRTRAAFVIRPIAHASNTSRALHDKPDRLQTRPARPQVARHEDRRRATAGQVFLSVPRSPHADPPARSNRGRANFSWARAAMRAAGNVTPTPLILLAATIVSWICPVSAAIITEPDPVGAYVRLLTEQRAHSKMIETRANELIRQIEALLPDATVAQAAILKLQIQIARNQIKITNLTEEVQIKRGWDILILSLDDPLTPPQEDAPLEAFYFAPACGGSFPVSRFGAGETCLLTFGFIDPSTGLPVVGPPISSVLYEVNLDPDTPDLFVPLGSSSDLESHFSFLYTVNGFEPLIRATAFDTFGNPVILTRNDGVHASSGIVTIIDADAAAPGLMPLMGLGLAVMALLKFCPTRRRPATREVLGQYLGPV